MNIVPVVLFEDRSFQTERMQLPLQLASWEFVLEHQDWLTSRMAFINAIEQMDRLSGPAIILLDLGYTIVEDLDENQSVELEEWFKCPKHEITQRARLSPDQLFGLYLAKRALLNRKWYGELYIASNNLTFSTKLALYNMLREVERNGKVRIHMGDGVADNPERITREAVGYFVKDNDLILWFLQPPVLEADHSKSKFIGWFGEDYHSEHKNPSGYKLQINAIRERFSNWGAGESSAKALMYSSSPIAQPVLPDDHNARSFPVYFLKEFFGQDMSINGLNINSLINLPVEPGLPFMVALQTLLDELREGKNAPVKLQVIDHNVIALGIEPVRPCWQLSRSLWHGHKGNTCKAFLNAIEARVDRPFSMSEYPLATLLDGYKGIATPWITDNFVGISWAFRPRKEIYE